MQNKRLFLFAGYDKDGIVDKTLIHYLRSLSALGDTILIMDCDTSDTELKKLANIPNILHISAARHGEYDFGSYKRAYQYADEHKLLNQYDWIYLVNDSVYGPLYDIKPILQDLESRGADFIGMTDFENKWTPIQIQSWFVGMSQKLACEKFIANFMAGVTHQIEKQLIVLKYEVGLSQLVLRHGYKMATLVCGENGDVTHSMYHEPLKMLKAGIPFVKKNGLENLGGLQYLYSWASDGLVDDIYRHATRTGLRFIRISEYDKVFRATFLSVPLITIYRQLHEGSHQICYKYYLFDFIPVGKVFKRM